MLPLNYYYVEFDVEKCTGVVYEKNPEFCRASTKVRVFFVNIVEKSLVLQSVVLGTIGKEKD